MEIARRPSQLPSVMLDTQERLHLTSPGIDERQLPESEEQTHRYRYRGLRLLIQGRDRLFLVSLDSSVRLQFRFRNLPP